MNDFDGSQLSDTDLDQAAGGCSHKHQKGGDDVLEVEFVTYDPHSGAGIGYAKGPDGKRTLVEIGPTDSLGRQAPGWFGTKTGTFEPVKGKGKG